MEFIHCRKRVWKLMENRLFLFCFLMVVEKHSFLIPSIFAIVCVSHIGRKQKADCDLYAMNVLLQGAECTDEWTNYTSRVKPTTSTQCWFDQVCVRLSHFFSFTKKKKRKKKIHQEIDPRNKKPPFHSMWSQLQTGALWHFNESLFDTFLEDPQQIWVVKNEGGGSD